MTLSPDESSARPLSFPTEADRPSARKRSPAPHRRIHPWSPCAAIATLLLVSACASHAPRLTATQEAAQYEARAAGDYTPPGPPEDPWGPYITEASKRFDVPDSWIRQVMRVESGGELYHGGSLVTSPVGAMGLMQIMPATYDGLKAELNLSDDPYDPHNSILAGTAYIREMYDLYGSPGFLAAYNAGPGTLDAYLTGNRRLPGETRRYVAMIAPYIEGDVPRNRSQADLLAMNAVQTRNGTAPADDGQTVVASADAPAPAPSPASAAPAPVVAAAPPVATAPPTVLAANAPAAPASPVLEPAPTPTQAPIVTAAASPAPAPEPPVAREAPEAVDVADDTPPAPRPRSRHVPPQDAPRPVEVAMLPEPPPEPSRSQPSTQVAAFIPEPPAPPSSQGSHKLGFRLVTPAFAEAMPHHGGGSEWSIQLGAYGNQSQAHAVTGTARGQEPRLLAGARPDIASVRDGRATVYRARLTGLSREGAIAACQKLARSRTSCMVVSPDT